MSIHYVTVGPHSHRDKVQQQVRPNSYRDKRPLACSEHPPSDGGVSENGRRHRGVECLLQSRLTDGRVELSSSSGSCSSSSGSSIRGVSSSSSSSSDYLHMEYNMKRIHYTNHRYVRTLFFSLTRHLSSTPAATDQAVEAWYDCPPRQLRRGRHSGSATSRSHRQVCYVYVCMYTSSKR